MSSQGKFYTFKSGDTLSQVAERHGTNVNLLCKINGIKDPDKIEAGETIALHPKAVMKVTLQLLDADRNPLAGAKVRLEYGERRKVLSSGKSGRIPAIITQTPTELVKIFIARTDGTWKKITEISSGWGNKLVTLVSPKVKLDCRTLPHPKDVSDRPEPDNRTNKMQAAVPENPEATEAKGKPQGDYGDGKGPKTSETVTENGLPICKVTNDQAKLDFLRGYVGEKITEEDYLDAARFLGCEVAFVKAVAEIEGQCGFDKKRRPIILYERHIFAKHTKPINKFNNMNPDISSKKRYKRATLREKKSIKEGNLNPDDYYGYSYPRLAKAYSLDRVAALKACSWGKFQIMGMNHGAAGFDDVGSFVAAMCRSEREHLRAFVNFINSKSHLKKAANTKNWEMFALYYNGEKYQEYSYDIKLKEAYHRYEEKNRSDSLLDFNDGSAKQDGGS